jgi:hypothetical protein
MNPFSEVSFAIVTTWFDPFGQRDSVVSVYQEAAALGQFPYLSEKPFCFRCACCSKTTDQEAFALPGMTHYRPRFAPIKEYLRTILP